MIDGREQEGLFAKCGGEEDVWIWMEEVLELGAGCCSCAAVCNHKWKNKIGSAAQDVSHPPARPEPAGGNSGKNLNLFCQP